MQVASAVPVRDAGVRLQRGVHLDGGGEGAGDEVRVVLVARSLDAAHRRPTAPAHRRRPTDVAVPAGRDTRALGRAGCRLALGARLVDHSGARLLGLAGVEHRGPLVVVHPHLTGGGAGRGERGAGDRGDRLADVAHGAVRGQQVDHRGPLRRLDGADDRVRPGRADDHALELAVQVHVGGVAGPAGDLVHGLDPRRLNGIGASVVVLSSAGRGDRGVDALVGAAPAQVAGHRVGDLRPVRRDVAVLAAPAVDERRTLDREAGRAVAALQTVVRGERPLHGVAAAEPFDGGDRPAVQRGAGEQAAHHRRAVDLHGARPADARAADQLGAGQAEGLPEHLDGGLVGVGVQRAPLAVDLDLHGSPSVLTC